VAAPALYTLGPSAAQTPAGGLYNGIQSAPAVDATGGLAFLARVVGGTTSEVLVYLPPTGGGTPILVGDAAPLSGFFAGSPFSPPVLTDAGAVVFRAFVARGPTSVGIFRWQDGQLAAVVRAGDPSPNSGHPPFLDLVGNPSANPDGAVAFSATVQGAGRGIYVADRNGIRVVARRGDPAPGVPGTTFSSLGANPTINERGQVAFRGTSQVHDDASNTTIRQEGLFLADGSHIDELAADGMISPEGLTVVGLRDPVVSDAPSLVFRAPVSDGTAVWNGVFLVDRQHAASIALEREPLGGGMMLSGLSGDPVVAPDGTLAFLASRVRSTDPSGTLLQSLGPTVFRATAAGLVSLVSHGDRAVLGGTFRTLAQPSINAPGHVAFRANFQSGTGGTGGLYVAGDTGITPAVLVKEVAPTNVRFSSFGARPSINAADEIAFSAGLSQGDARTGLFLATPARLVTQKVAIRFGGSVVRPRDRVRVRLRLLPGRLSNGVNGLAPITLALHDTDGALWTVSIPTRRLRQRGAVQIATPGRGDLRKVLRALRLRVLPSGVVQVAARSAVLDLTRNGVHELHPPLTLLFGVGDDSATLTFDCKLGKHGGNCGG